MVDTNQRTTVPLDSVKRACDVCGCEFYAGDEILMEEDEKDTDGEYLVRCYCRKHEMYGQEFRDDVLSRIEAATDDLANASAAQAWSTPSDDDNEKYTDDDGEGLMIVADFGDWLAVNGDLVMTKEHEAGGWDLVDIPKDFEEKRGGGRIPCVEEEVSVDSIAYAVSRAMGVTAGDKDERKVEMAMLIDKIVNEHFKQKQFTYTSVSGDATYYAKKKEESDGE